MVVLWVSGQGSLYQILLLLVQYNPVRSFCWHWSFSSWLHGNFGVSNGTSLCLHMEHKWPPPYNGSAAVWKAGVAVFICVPQLSTWRGVTLVSLVSKDSMFEADETCNGKKRESKVKRMYFYIITFICFGEMGTQIYNILHISWWLHLTVVTFLFFRDFQDWTSTSSCDFTILVLSMWSSQQCVPLQRWFLLLCKVRRNIRSQNFQTLCPSSTAGTRNLRGMKMWNPRLGMGCHSCRQEHTCGHV